MLQGNYCSAMFANCTSITKIPSNWQGFKASNFDAMFMNCTSLTSIDSWDGLPTNYSPTCASAFARCTSLTKIPNKWEGRPLGNLNYMFEGCTNLIDIPTATSSWSGFSGNNTGSIYRMFANCTSLTVDPKPIMDGINRTNGSQMFAGCVNLQNYTEYASPTSVYSSYFI